MRADEAGTNGGRDGERFDPAATLEHLLESPVAELGPRAAILVADPHRLAATAEAVRAVSSRSPERGIAAAERLAELVAIADPPAAASAAVHRALARALAWAGRFDESIDAGRRAASIADAADVVEESVRTRLAIMHPLTELGRLDEAIETGRRAQTLAMAGDRPELAARADVNLGIALRRRDRPRDAVACFERARPHLLGEPPVLAALENSLGEALVELQDFAGAEAAFERARSGFDAAGAALQAAIAEENLADLAYRQGRLHRALALFEIARRRLGGDDAAMHRARVLAEEADARSMLGLHAAAVDGYCAALPLLDRFGLVLEAARARKGMGAALRRLDRPSEAATALAAASQAFTELGHRTARGRCDLIRAALELDANRPASARRLTTEALAAFAERPADAAAARLMLGEIAAAEGADELAEAELAAGLALARALDLPPLLADLLHAAGRRHRAAGRLAEARAVLEEAVEQVERVRGMLQARRFRAAFMGHRRSVHEELLAVALDRHAAGRAVGADAGAGEAAGDAEVAAALRAGELGRHRGLLDDLVAAEGREHRVAGASTAPGIEAAGVDDATAADEPGRLEAALATERRALNVLYSRLGDVALAGEADRDAAAALRTEIRIRERRAADHAMRLESVGGDSPLLAAPVPLERVRRDLPAGTRLVVFLAAGDALARLTIEAGGVELVPRACDLGALAEAVRRLRFQVERGLRPGADVARRRRLAGDARAAAIAVHRLAFAGADGELEGRSWPERLVVVPDGPLVGVPPGILHDGTDWLAARTAITTAPSASVHHRLLGRGPARTRGHLVVGVADEAAPRMLAEADGIASALAGGDAGSPVARLTGDAATADAVRAAMSRAASIHLASHGRFDRRQPHASGLRLADRWLTAAELARIPLDADLVTLSGCETGVTGDDAGETVGIGRALLAAGARRVVASQWRVDDAVTEAVMERLHRATRPFPDASHADSGPGAAIPTSDVGAALRRVHHELVDEHPHPAHWGAFVLMGRT